MQDREAGVLVRGGPGAETLGNAQVAVKETSASWPSLRVQAFAANTAAIASIRPLSLVTFATSSAFSVTPQLSAIAR